MSDQLPSREEAKTLRNMAAAFDEYSALLPLVDAYAGGRLVDREAIDRDDLAEAVVEYLPDSGPCLICNTGLPAAHRVADSIVDAVVAANAAPTARMPFRLLLLNELVLTLAVNVPRVTSYERPSPSPPPPCPLRLAFVPEMFRVAFVLRSRT